MWHRWCCRQKGWVKDNWFSSKKQQIHSKSYSLFPFHLRRLGRTRKFKGGNPRVDGLKLLKLNLWLKLSFRLLVVACTILSLQWCVGLGSVALNLQANCARVGSAGWLQSSAVICRTEGSPCRGQQQGSYRHSEAGDRCCQKAGSSLELQVQLQSWKSASTIQFSTTQERVRETFLKWKSNFVWKSIHIHARRS